jgi:hypothetical protein
MTEMQMLLNLTPDGTNNNYQALNTVEAAYYDRFGTRAF